MRARQFINESVTFGPARLVEPKMFSGEEWWEKVDAECPACDGTGEEKWDDEPKSNCWYCNGTGKVEQTISNAPELDVSNANAHVVLKILGIKNYSDELMGRIPSSEFPALQQRLLKLKNIAGKRQQFEIPSTTTKSAGGPTMIDFGVSSTQVEHYIDRLMEIIKFAQDTNSDNVYLTWA